MIVVIVIAALLIVLAATGVIDNLTGKAVQIERTCTDSDGGDNKDVKGTVTQIITSSVDNYKKTNEFTDKCIDGDIKIKEYYCSGYGAEGKVESKTMYCDDICVDGVCVSKQ